MMKETQLQKNYSRAFIFLLFTAMAFLSQAQSCVCFQNHFLNDYKEADFVAQITITDLSSNHRMINEDRAQFNITTTFKGQASSPLFIKQEIGNSNNNSNCRLFLKTGDEVIVFAQIINNELVTTSCKRNSFIYKNDPKFNTDNQNLTGTLKALSQFNKRIEQSSTDCTSLKNDTDVIKGIRKLKLKEEQAYFGLYNIKFSEEGNIEFIGVLSPFNKEIDKKIRIMLIKKKWGNCELSKNQELLVGYFYHPSSTYRKAYLSTF